MRDIVVLAALVVSFAAFVTTHVWICGALAIRTRPRWRALVAFLVPPLAPIWSFRAGSRFAAVLWGAAVVVYTVALVVGSA